MNSMQELIGLHQNHHAPFVLNPILESISACQSKSIVVTDACLKKNHRFSLSNNMDPGPQPPILAAISQIEEIIIARVSPILQVTQAHRGQYK